MQITAQFKNIEDPISVTKIELHRNGKDSIILKPNSCKLGLVHHGILNLNLTHIDMQYKSSQYAMVASSLWLNRNKLSMQTILDECTSISFTTLGYSKDTQIINVVIDNINPTTNNPDITFEIEDNIFKQMHKIMNLSKSNLYYKPRSVKAL